MVLVEVVFEPLAMLLLGILIEEFALQTGKVVHRLVAI